MIEKHAAEERKGEVFEKLCLVSSFPFLSKNFALCQMH